MANLVRNGATAIGPQQGRAVRLIWIVVGAFVVLLRVASPVLAHAELVGSTPQAGAELSRSPSDGTLEFSEPVRVVAGSVRLVNEAGTQLSTGAPETRGSRVRFSIPTLPPGAYVMTWRVISEDGHPLRGASTFRVALVGDQSAAARAGDALFASATTNPRVGAAAAALRAVALLTLLLLIGMLAMSTAAGFDASARLRLSRIATITAVIGGAVGAAAVAVQGPYLSGRGFGALRDGILLDATLEDRTGRAIAARAGLTVMIGLATARCWRRSPPGRERLVLAVGSVAVVASGGAQAFTGHGSSGTSAVLTTVMTVVHVVAAGLWIGGLAVFPLGATSPRRALARFSMLAWWSVVAVAVSGAFAIWRQLGSVDALTSTTMGRLVQLKLLLVAVLLVLGWRTRRGLVGDDDRRVVRLRAEALVAAAVVATTAVLTAVTPGRLDVARPTSVTMRSAEVVVELTVEPARTGKNTVHLYALRPNGSPLPVTAIRASASLPSREIAEIDLPLVRAGSNHFQILGFDVAVAGNWRIDAVVGIDEFTEVEVGATVVFR